MAIKETVVLEVDVNSALKGAAQLTQELAALKKEKQALDKEIGNATPTDAQAKALTLLTNRIAVVTKEQRAFNGIIQNTAQALKAEEGSIEGNRRALSALTAEYIKLAKPPKELTDKIKQLSDTLKQQEGAIGNTSRNVGNYKESILEAAKGLGGFGNMLSGVNKGLLTGGDYTSNFAGKFVPFLAGGAIGLGLAAIVAAMELIKIGLERNSEAAEAVERAFAGVNNVIGLLADKTLKGLGDQFDKIRLKKCLQSWKLRLRT